VEELYVVAFFLYSIKFKEFISIVVIVF